MTTPHRHTEASQRLPLMDTLLNLLAGCAMVMVSITFLAWLRF